MTNIQTKSLLLILRWDIINSFLFTVNQIKRGKVPFSQRRHLGSVYRISRQIHERLVIGEECTWEYLISFSLNIGRLARSGPWLLVQWWSNSSKLMPSFLFTKPVSFNTTRLLTIFSSIQSTQSALPHQATTTIGHEPSRRPSERWEQSIRSSVALVHYFLTKGHGRSTSLRFCIQISYHGEELTQGRRFITRHKLANFRTQTTAWLHFVQDDTHFRQFCSTSLNPPTTQTLHNMRFALVPSRETT